LVHAFLFLHGCEKTDGSRVTEGDTRSKAEAVKIVSFSSEGFLPDFIFFSCTVVV
jgi:hypothetical protein